MQNEGLVRNVANEKQVRHAAQQERVERQRELDDVRAVLATPQGRRLVARLIAHCRVHQSVWHPSAEIHKRAGAQDVGHFILGEVVKADKELGAQMITEAYASALGGESNV